VFICRPTGNIGVTLHSRKLSNRNCLYTHEDRSAKEQMGWV
jgi:hypothetical protein